MQNTRAVDINVTVMILGKMLSINFVYESVSGNPFAWFANFAVHFIRRFKVCFAPGFSLLLADSIEFNELGIPGFRFSVRATLRRLLRFNGRRVRHHRRHQNRRRDDRHRQILHDVRLNRYRDDVRDGVDAAGLRWNRSRQKTKTRHPAWNDGDAAGIRAAAGARAAVPARPVPRHRPELFRWLP